MKPFWCLYCQLWTDFTNCSSVFFFKFNQVNAGNNLWEQKSVSFNHLLKILPYPNILHYLAALTVMKGIEIKEYVALRETCLYSEFLWSTFPRIRTEYGEMWSISPCSVWMRENMDQKNSDTDTFHTVFVWKRLTHFSPIIHFYTHQKRLKTFGCLAFWRGIEMEPWAKISWSTSLHNLPIGYFSGKLITIDILPFFHSSEKAIGLFFSSLKV